MATEARCRRIRQVVERRQRAVVVLEDVHDPQNVGAVIRSCEAFGVGRVMLVFDRERAFDPRRECGTASTAAEGWVRFEIFDRIDACLGALRDEGFTTVATVAGGEGESIYVASLDEQRVALLLGNERRGLSARAMEGADRRVSIPMRGVVRSLNVSVTAAVCLYEMTRRRMELGMERYLLGDAERAELGRWLMERRASGAMGRARQRLDD